MILAFLALFAAGLAAYAAQKAARLTDEGLAAQSRIELFSELSRKVSDYIIVALENGDTGVSAASRQRLLSDREVQVEAAFTRISDALNQDVSLTSFDDVDIASRRSGRGQAVARLRSGFAVLKNSVLRSEQTASRAGLRASLDGFAAQFSPVLGEQVELERRLRDRAFAGVGDLRESLTKVVIAVALVVPIVVMMVYLGLFRPLLTRLGKASEAAGIISNDVNAFALPTRKRDELGFLFARVNLLASRLERRREKVDFDRARLEDIVDERTTELRGANQRLSQVDAERRRFFADVGHELRTPLTVILGETELAQGDIDRDQAQDALRVIRTRAQRLNRRIDDLLRIAKSDTGQIELQSTQIDMSDVIRSGIEDVTPLLKRAGMEIVTELSSELTLEGDADWLRQVIAGLLENAVKYGGPKGKVTISAHRDADMLKIKVLDTGPGIAPELQSQVFERFVRGDVEKETRGFGVGLALSRWIIEEHGGKIDLESPGWNGSGTAVSIDLPSVFAAD